MRASALAFAILLSLYPFSSLSAFTFTEFVKQADLGATLGNDDAIGFTFAGNKFVGSVYFGTNNNQLYSTDLNGGNVALFGAPIPGFSGEIYVSSSLNLGGFAGRDIYAGAESSSTVYRIANDASSQGTFVSSGITGGVRSIGFDPYGLYGNQMIVATNAGNIYTVDNLGTPTLLANVGEDSEGLGFAPQQFGPYVKGTLFVASEGSGSIRAIDPAGSSSVVATVNGAEMLSFVPLNLGASGDPLEGFYSAAYPNNVLRAPASDFTAYKGDIVVTDEIGHGIYDVHWDGSMFVTTFLDTFPAQPEDGIFVTLDVLRPNLPEPSTIVLLLLGGCPAILTRRPALRSSAASGAV